MISVNITTSLHILTIYDFNQWHTQICDGNTFISTQNETLKLYSTWVIYNSNLIANWTLLRKKTKPKKQQQNTLNTVSWPSIKDNERISSPQNENWLIIYSPPSHPRCSCLYFFSGKEIKFLEENIPGLFII